MSLDHLTEQRQQFVREYIKTGDHVESARRAGYSRKTLVNQACKLKRELAEEISGELRHNLLANAGNALQTLIWLSENAVSESVRAKCCMDLLDRAGFKPVTKQEVLKPQRTLEEVDAELRDLIGKSAHFLNSPSTGC
jgi:hypothetical protein